MFEQFYGAETMATHADADLTYLFTNTHYVRTEEEVAVGDEAVELLDGVALQDDAHVHGQEAG